jgi:hypothetical protein
MNIKGTDQLYIKCSWEGNNKTDYKEIECDCKFRIPILMLNRQAIVNITKYILFGWNISQVNCIFGGLSG